MLQKWHGYLRGTRPLVASEVVKIEESPMPWSPDVYEQFKEERFAPFVDLVALIEPRSGLSVVDLGCGSGELTARLAELLPDSMVTGIDASPQMLAKAHALQRPGLTFIQHDMATFSGRYDLLFSHAALHWLPDHEQLISRLLAMVNPGGQLAVQLPSNHCHPSHTLIIETAQEEPFCSALAGWYRTSPVLGIDRYAELLHDAGAEEIRVLEKVYPHLLKDADAVADWTRGTTLVPYLERLPAELHEPFLAAYRQKLRTLWPAGPVFYTFRRTLFAARRP